MRVYKLTELAEMEGVHYRTVVNHKNEYDRIEIPYCGRTLIRYLRKHCYVVDYTPYQEDLVSFPHYNNDLGP